MQRSALCWSRREVSKDIYLQNLASIQPRTSPTETIPDTPIPTPPPLKPALNSDASGLYPHHEPSALRQGRARDTSELFAVSPLGDNSTQDYCTWALSPREPPRRASPRASKARTSCADLPAEATWGVCNNNNNNNNNSNNLYAESGQTLQGSFSAVSKPTFATKYAFESARRDLHNALFFDRISLSLSLSLVWGAAGIFLY